MSAQEEGTRVPRYYLFIGCSDPECTEHSHLVGWKCLAVATDDEKEIAQSIQEMPEGLWWQLVDLLRGGLVADSTEKPRH